MGINTPSDIETNLQIGPTDTGMVRIYVSGGAIELREEEPGHPDRFTEDPSLFQNGIRAGCRRTRRRIGPTVPRFDEPHFDKTEVEHRSRSLADILSQLGPDEDDYRFALVNPAHGLPLPGRYWQTLRNRAPR